jgi:DNA-binding CsgD family transcriptional regulator
VFVSQARQRITELLGDGRSPSEIAHALGVSRNTVYYHLRRLREEAERNGHTVPAAVAPKARWSVATRDAVHRLLAEGVSRADIATRLGVTRSTVTYHARRLGEPIDETCARRYDWAKIQAYYDHGHSVRACSRVFGFSLQSWHAARLRGQLVTRSAAMPLSDLLVVDRHRSRQNVKRRLLAEGLKQAACEICGSDTWLGQPIPLDLHHANRVRNDNRLENLMLLCPNCHAAVEGEASARSSSPVAIVAAERQRKRAGP